MCLGLAQGYIEPKDITIYCDGIKVTQKPNGHIWLSKGDEELLHINSAVKFTKEELQANAKEFIKLIDVFEDIFEDEGVNQ